MHVPEYLRVKVRGMEIEIQQYHDWWFDNAIEFLGHLLEELGVNVEWREGIVFDALNDGQLEMLVERIEGLIEPKLKYPKENEETGLIEKKWRVYLPLTASNKRGSYKYKYLSGFLGKEPTLKKRVVTSLLSDSINEKKKENICEICSRLTSFDLEETTQGVYPVANNNLKSLNGVRSMKTSFKNCLLCSFLGYIQWLDDIPFVWYMDVKGNNKTDYAYYLYPKIEDIQELHAFKEVLREVLTERVYSNIIVMRGERERYATDEYSLLLSLFENMVRNIKDIERLEDIFCERWICLFIEKGGVRYTNLEEIKIPNIKSLEKIFKELKRPYSNFVDKTFTKSLITGNANNELSRKNKYLMSKGIIMNNFKVFAKAFQIRQNCILAGVSKKMLDKLIYSWGCEG